MIALLIPIFTRWGFTQRLAKIAAWAVVVLAILAVLAVIKVNYDGSVIERHETKRNEAAAPASERAIEDRAQDALRNAELRDERDKAIAHAEAVEAAKAPEARAVLPPTTVALNCARMRQAYAAGELAKMYPCALCCTLLDAEFFCGTTLARTASRRERCWRPSSGWSVQPRRSMRGAIMAFSIGIAIGRWPGPKPAACCSRPSSAARLST